MSLWGKTDQANNAPKYQILDNKSANGETLFANSTIGAFVPSMATGVYAVDQTEARVASVAGRRLSPGWTQFRFGTGPVANLVASGGADYANGDVVRVSGGEVNATFNVATNAAGGSLTLTATNFGRGFSNVGSATIAVANSTGGATTGSGATFTLTLGGRAGRVNHELLVCAKITGDASDDTLLPDA
jgi:hypothetical protein